MSSLTVNDELEIVELEIKNRNNLDNITLFTLENKNGTRLLVSDFGATVISLFVKDKNGISSDIVLGYENKSDYINDEFYIGSVVGRYANRIAGDTVVIDSIEYKINSRDDGFHLHGGYEGFNKKIFEVTPFHNDENVGLVLEYKSPHLEEGFPGNLTIQVIYTLDDNDQWTIEYKAITDQTTIINFTQHTYFNLSGKLNTSIDNHNIFINSNYYLPVTNLHLPTGAIKDVANTAFDFTSPKNIGKAASDNETALKLSKGYDHSWVLKNTDTNTLKHAATVTEPTSGRILDVFTTEPSLHLYTGNFLENVNGKKGEVYHPNSGLCLETQHFPNSPNHEHFPTTILKVGEEFYSKTVFKFSTV